MLSRRRLGLTTAACLVIANMIGSGVFTTTGFSLADLGSRGLVLAAWGLGGVIAMLGAVCYGAIGRRLPESGGEYMMLSRTVHPLAGFLAGWISLVAGFTAPIAVAALLVAAYIGVKGPTGNAIATLAIVLSGALHGVRLGGGVRVQNTAVLLKLLAIGAFVGYGAVRLFGGAATADPPPMHASFPLGVFATSLVWISFSYSGWNAAIYVAGEVRDPGYTLNRSLWMGTAVVTVAYLALNAVFLYSAEATALMGQPDVGRIAAKALGGPVLEHALTALILLALFTSISSMVMIGPRVYAQMADDGLFPRFLQFRGQVPASAVALQCLLAILVVWISGLRELLGFIGFTLGLSTCATVLALMRLRHVEGRERVPLPGYPWLPLAYVSFTLFAVVFMAKNELSGHGAPEILAALATIAAGAALYPIARRGIR